MNEKNLMPKIYAFALKWLEKFKDPNVDYKELVGHYMADDCESLGFEMDSGHAFADKYGDAYGNSKELKKVIDDVDDIMLLGSAVYSAWRYFNHWAWSGKEILESKNREWFILALNRMRVLSGITEKATLRSIGKIQKIRIFSNTISMMRLLPEDEVEQHLTITRDGRVFFSSYVFGDGFDRFKRYVRKNFKIGADKAECIMTALEEGFSTTSFNWFICDTGEWTAEITNDAGTKFKFQESIGGEIKTNDGTDVSDIIREELNMPELYAFDGNCAKDRVNRIRIVYDHIMKTGSEGPHDKNKKLADLKRTEILVIDRKSGTVEFKTKIGPEWSVSEKCHIEEGVRTVLDDLNPYWLFRDVQGNPPDTVTNDTDMKRYTISVDYERKMSRTISGTFDQNGLPHDFPEFIEKIWKFMCQFVSGEIFDPGIYGKPRRREGELIFCSVTFNQGGKSYYYLADDDSVKVGDMVLVPVGEENQEKLVQVVQIEYFSPENAPMPPEKVKHIAMLPVD